MISLLGLLIPFLRTGRALRTDALRFASHAKKTHQKDTRANWMMVKVTGMGREVKMALDEVLVMMDVMYQKAQRPCAAELSAQVRDTTRRDYMSSLSLSRSLFDHGRSGVEGRIGYAPTTSFMDTGAFSDSAISCTFSWMLAPRPRVLTVLIASLKLFCLPCLVFVPAVMPAPPLGSSRELVSRDLRAGHRSLECSPGGRPLGSGRGLGPREMSL